MAFTTSSKEDFRELVDSLDLDTIETVADLGALSPHLAYQIHRRYESKITIIPVNSEGAFDKDALDVAHEYERELLALGVPKTSISIVNDVKDAKAHDVVLSLGGFGDEYKIKNAKPWLNKLLGPNSRFVLDIRKGSGAYPFLRDYGNSNTISTNDSGKKPVSRVIMSVEPKAEATVDTKWREIVAPLIEPDGFYIEDGAHSFTYIHRSDTLIVTFDNLDIAMNNRADRRPWGFSYFEKMNWSMLGVMANGWTWYRDPWVTEQFDILRNEGFFDQFKRVVFYGASMGGYAALAFSAAAPGSDVVVFSPQTTLDKSIVPWETRYKTAWGADFSDHYGDAAKTIQSAANVHVFYDPYAPLDNAHAKRLKGENVKQYYARLMGHKVGSSFQNMNILQPLVNAALAGELTDEFYREKFQARKQYRRYLTELLTRARNQNHDKLALAMAKRVLAERGEDGFFRKHIEEIEAKR